jgi:hypothetical protein
MEELYIFYKSMEIIAPMWSNSIQTPGKILLTCTAGRSSEEVTINIYEHCLIETSSKKKVTMPFDFDLKFGFTASPPSIYFEKQEERVKYDFKAESDLRASR